MNAVSVSLLVVLLSAATFTDLKQHRVPNLVSFGGIVLALLFHSVGDMGAGIVFALAGMGAGFAVFVVPYAFRVMGAGDVKLMMMVGAFLGWSQTLDAALYTLGVGFLAGVIILAKSGHLARTVDRYGAMIAAMAARQPLYMAPTDNDVASKRFPYAAAIAVGTLVQLFLMNGA